jgi:hypothetical protein
VLEMPRPLLDKLLREVRELGTVGHLTFSAVGEDAMYSDIEYAARSFAACVPTVTMFTNGTSLDKALILALRKAGLAGFNVSIEGTEKAGYEFIRRGARFETFEENLRYMTSLGFPTVGLYTTVMAENLDSLRRLPAFAAGAGVKSVNYSLLKGPEIFGKNGLSMPSQEELSAFVDQSAAELDSLGITHNLALVRKLYTAELLKKGYLNTSAYDEERCSAPFSMMVINQLGQWKPCCSDSQFFSDHNLNDHTLFEAFNCPNMQQIRNGILTGVYPGLCRTHTCGKGTIAPASASHPLVRRCTLHNPRTLAKLTAHLRPHCQGKRVALRCASEFTVHLVQAGCFQGATLVGIVDQNTEKARALFPDLPAFTPEQLPAGAYDTLVICSPRAEAEILRGLPPGTHALCAAQLHRELAKT